MKTKAEEKGDPLEGIIGMLLGSDGVAVDECLFYLDRDLRYVWISGESIFGMDASVALGKSDCDLLSGTEAERLLPIKEQVLSTGRTRQVRIDQSVLGVMRSFDCSYYPWLDGEGRLLGLAGVVRDSIAMRGALAEIQKMALAVESAPTSIVLTDLEGRIEYVNSSLLKNSGSKERSEIIGRSIFDFTNELGRSRLCEEVFAALHSSGQWRGEIPLTGEDGCSYMTEMICALVRDDRNEPTYLIANFYNITERKRAEEALLLDDSRLEALQRLNQMDEASLKEIADFALEAGVKLTGSKIGYLAFVDEEEETLFMHSWSKAALRDCMVESKRLIYHLSETGLWGDAIRERKAVITNDYAKSTQKRGTPEGHIEIIRHMNVPIMDKGRIVIVAGLGNKEVDYDDSDVRQLTLLMSGMWKILLRRRTEKALRESQRALSTLMGNLPGMAYRCKFDRRRSMEFISEGCLELTGYPSLELLDSDGVPYADLIHPEDRDCVWGEILEALAEKRHFRLTYRIKTNTGVKWVLEQGLGIFQPDGQISALEGFVSDITERKLAEEALKRTQEELERRVADRTEWLLRSNEALKEEMVKHKRTERELRSAQRAADSALKAKGEFLANMSHEIRTPMNAVIGLAGLLLETDLSPEQRDFVETIHSSGDSLLVIINDILDFSKIEEGKMRLERLPFDLREAVRASIEMVEARALEKNLSLSSSVDGRIAPILLGDSIRLRQVLANLLSNAVKFTDRGGIAVEVKPGEMPGELHISVSDTGIGIRAEDMDKLFRSFTQLDASTSRKYGGTGLGLAISRRLVELLGGRIWVLSEPTKGSTFHFTIIAPEFSGDAARHYFAGKRVIAIIESEKTLEELASHAHFWGMQIFPVISASEAKELDVGRFDIAILDLDVAGGEDLRDHLMDRIPTIALVSSGRAALTKCTVFKPISQSDLASALTQALLPIEHPHRSCMVDAPERSLRILLAEDNPVNQKVARLMLKRMGHTADVAANGREVLSAVTQKSYDIVLMDVQMPEMDGIEATRMIHEMKLERPPKILAMTAYALEGDRERCLGAGMDGYISKPVQLEELRQAIHRLSGDLSGS